MTSFSADDLPTANQVVVVVEMSMGRGIYLVRTPTNELFFAVIPAAYRNLVWIFRRDFLVVEYLPVPDRNVTAIIVRIIYQESYRYFVENNAWPRQFSTEWNKEANIVEYYAHPRRAPAAA